MTSTRVLLVDLPNLVRDMLVSLMEEIEEVEWVGHVHSHALDEAVAETDPEYVIVGAERHDLPESCRRFLDERARVRLLGVEAVDGEAFLYELRPERVDMGPVSPGELLDAVRSTTGAET